jgi:hypothetical protein
MAEVAVQNGYEADENGKIVKKSPILDAELVNDTVCLYDNETFVCQASSLEEIAKMLTDKKDPVVVEYQKEFYVLEQGSVKKTEVKNAD